jgi:putative acetyltransferase
MSLVIRTETADDADAIRAVEIAAFGREAEADLVDAVRDAHAGVLSLIAVWRDEIVGHVLFTPVTVGPGMRAVGLGPLAVHPDHQRQGVGSALVREGLLRLGSLGHGAVVVLGEPRYYRRFGFTTASSFGVRWERPVPDEVFMAIELRPRSLSTGGTVRYLPQFTIVD